MPTSVRLDPDTEALVARLARQRGKTRSGIIREAIGSFAERVDVTESTYETLARWVGCVDSGGLHRSRETGRVFRELLERKRDARRSR